MADEISGKHPLMCYNPIVGDWVNPLAKEHLQPPHTPEQDAEHDRELPR
jgi:hypothetical protein